MKSGDEDVKACNESLVFRSRVRESWIARAASGARYPSPLRSRGQAIEMHERRTCNRRAGREGAPRTLLHETQMPLPRRAGGLVLTRTRCGAQN